MGVVDREGGGKGDQYFATVTKRKKGLLAKNVAVPKRL
jgi:hypothetical protein